jgi:hypothetical protein
MRLPWQKRPKLSPDEIGARCPSCHCELPVSFEQRLLLADSQPCWLFCPLCVRLVAGQAFTRKSAEAGASGALASESVKTSTNSRAQALAQPA